MFKENGNGKLLFTLHYSMKILFFQPLSLFKEAVDNKQEMSLRSRYRFEESVFLKRFHFASIMNIIFMLLEYRFESKKRISLFEDYFSLLGSQSKNR